MNRSDAAHATPELERQRLERHRIALWCMQHGVPLSDDSDLECTIIDAPNWGVRGHTLDLMYQGKLRDYSRGCVNPYTNRWRSRDDNVTYLTPCGGRYKDWLGHEHQCAPCQLRKSEKRRRRTFGKVMREMDRSKRTWMNTRTYDWSHIIVWLQDTHRIPEMQTELSPGEKRHLAGWFKSDEHKRLKRQPGCPPYRQGTAWEPHKSGDPHAHTLIHETTHAGVVEMRQFAATFIQPRGRRPPKRREGEGDHAYYKRLIQTYLWPGWCRWKAIAHDASPEARKERLRLPFQPGRFDSDLIRDKKRAARYAGKAARYVSKEQGRFFGTPGYGARDPQPPADAGPSASNADPLGAPHPGPQGPPAHALPQSGVAERLQCQDIGAHDASRAPRPPQTGPPRPPPLPPGIPTHWRLRKAGRHLTP